MERYRLTWALPGAVAIVIVLLVRPAGAGDAAAAPAGAAAMRIYRDPETGVIGAPPPGVLADEAARAAERARTTAVEPLVEEPVTASAGGEKVNLHGQFQAAVTRHLSGSRAGAHECTQPGAAPHE